jgi:hypothetical protein
MGSLKKENMSIDLKAGIGFERLFSTGLFQTLDRKIA